LTPFKGKTIRWRFNFVSNVNVQADGFYFDDMVLNVSLPTTTQTLFLEAKDFTLSQNYPNPTNRTTTIDIQLNDPKTPPTTLVVTDILGKTVLTKSLQVVDNQKIVLDTEGWSAGVYFSFLQTENGQKRSAARRLMVH
jgi:carboxypeptidase T